MPVSSSPSRGYSSGVRRCRPTMPHMSSPLIMRFVHADPRSARLRVHESLKSRQVLVDLPRTYRSVVGEELVALDGGEVARNAFACGVEYAGDHVVTLEFVDRVEQCGRQRWPVARRAQRARVEVAPDAVE